jgi:2-pyrone-4,6-dicarboxylate lactonase
MTQADIGPVAPNNRGPHPAPRRPRLALPAHSTDSHCHVFGPPEKFPYAADRPFTPVAAPREQVARLQRFLGFERAVIVQSSGHGSDHSVLLDALRADPETRRGVALISDALTGRELEELDAAGVCGARLNFVQHLGGAPEASRQETTLRRIQEMGWHAEIHVEGSGIVEFSPMIRQIAGPVVIDHMARVDVRQGLDGPAVRSLFDLLERGNAWVKVSGIDRVSVAGPPYADALRLAGAIVERFPQRVLWGSDYPHVNILGDAPDDGLLVDLIETMAPSEELRDYLLVRNPAELFGF